MSIHSILTFGYGSFGSVKRIPTFGYDLGSAPPPPVIVPVTIQHTEMSGGGAAAKMVPIRIRRRKKDEDEMTALLPAILSVLRKR